MTIFSDLVNKKRGQPGQALVQVLSADGAISIEDGIVFITKASPVAATLAGPSANGLVLIVVSTTAQAHVVTHNTPLFNGVAGTATFAALAGATAEFRSYNGTWFAHTGTLITYA